MNDDGRGGDQYRVHRKFLTKTFQSCSRFDFHQREEGTKHGRTQQPSRGNESCFHPAQQQRKRGNIYGIKEECFARVAKSYIIYYEQSLMKRVQLLFWNLFIRLDLPGFYSRKRVQFPSYFCDRFAIVILPLSLCGICGEFTFGARM